MPTIYQKYRPQKFSDLSGQEHIIQTVTNEIKNNKIAHAYLFFGPRGIGKTTIARLLAKSLNCKKRQAGEYEPCNECDSCADIAKSRHIDVIEIDAASHTGVDNVRENIIENAQFKPTTAKHKIFIIDEVHMLSTSAFNALLKTLEEPPQNVIFILATTELHKLPATIISRCQRFNYKKIPYDEMMERMNNICDKENIKVDKKVLERIINKSDGCLRDAESFLGQIFSLNLKKITDKDAEMILPSSNAETVLQFIEHILQKQAQLAIELLQQLMDDGVNLDQFAYDAIEILRLMMILQIDKTKDIKIDYSDKDAKTIKKLSSEVATAGLVNMIESLIIRRTETKSAPIPQLPLELFVVEFTETLKHLNTKTPKHTEKNDGEIEQHINIEQHTNTEILKQTDNNNENSKKNERDTGAGKISKLKAKLSSITSRKSIVTTIEDVQKKWAELVDKVIEQNASLSFILKMSDIQNIEKNGTLNIAVPYSLHKDKLEENKTKKIIDKCLFEVFEEKIILKCCVRQGGAIEKPEKKDEELNELAADFGGEVVS